MNIIKNHTPDVIMMSHFITTFLTLNEKVYCIIAILKYHIIMIGNISFSVWKFELLLMCIHGRNFQYHQTLMTAVLKYVHVELALCFLVTNYIYPNKIYRLTYHSIAKVAPVLSEKSL